MITEEQRQEILQKEVRVVFLFRVLVGLVVLAFAAMLAFIVYEQQQGAKQRDLIISCITPEGKCYQDGQRRTKSAVDDIATEGIGRSVVTRQVSIYAAFCLQTPPIPKSVDELEHCVLRLLKTEGDTFDYQPSVKEGRK